MTKAKKPRKSRKKRLVTKTMDTLDARQLQLWSFQVSLSVAYFPGMGYEAAYLWQAWFYAARKVTIQRRLTNG